MTKAIEDAANALAIRTALGVPTNAELAAVSDVADAAYVKPVDGIPHNDLHTGIRDQLDLADTALQPGALPVGTTVTAAQVSDAGAAGRTILQTATLPEIQSLVSGAGWLVLPDAATVSDWSAALIAIASNGTIVCPKNHTIDFSALTIPTGVMVVDTKLPGIILSQTELRTSATNNHLLIQSTVPGATRVHIEPQDFFPTGTASKLDMMFGNYDLSPLHYAIMAMFAENYSDGSARTDKSPYAAMANVKGVGDWWGIMPQMAFGFGDHNTANAVFASGYYFDTSDSVWRGPMVGPWRAGLVVASGVYAQAGGKLYQAAGAGTCGTTKPTHSASTVSDGGVSWTFVRDFAVSATAGAFRSTLLIGGRDEKPLFGLPSYGCQIATDVAVWSGKRMRYMQSATTQGWSTYQSSGTTDFYIEDAGGVSRARFGGTTSKFFSLNALALLSVPKTVSDNSATPSVASTRTLLLSNTAATSVTSFADGVAYQELIVRASNSNSTIVNGASIRTKSGANIVLSANDAAHFQANASGTFWTQL